MSTLVGVAIAFAAAYVDAGKYKTVLWMGAGIALFVSVFMVWLKERRRAESYFPTKEQIRLVENELAKLAPDHVEALRYVLKLGEHKGSGDKSYLLEEVLGGTDLLLRRDGNYVVNPSIEGALRSKIG